MIDKFNNKKRNESPGQTTGKGLAKNKGLCKIKIPKLFTKKRKQV